MSDFKLRRLGTIMTSEPGNVLEIEGVLNPAAVRGPDGELYLFPRLVGKGNYSRIGIVRVIFDKNGDPAGVKRLGIALEPETEYEMRPHGNGGCEDPRITFVEPLQEYLMTYTAFSPNGPRIALARSKDLLKWERLGLASFTPYEHIGFDGVDNKDACIFPGSIKSPHRHRPSVAMLHRPLFPGTRPEDIMEFPTNREVREHHECIWISYQHLPSGEEREAPASNFDSTHLLAFPSAPWEQLKIGAGAPPVLTKFGWLLIYHGVRDGGLFTDDGHDLIYSAGVMILDKEQPHKILYRSSHPVLTPDLKEEQVGIIANVVFPTGIDQRTDLGMPDRYDVYYGMADNCIGVARLDLPDELPKD